MSGEESKVEFPVRVALPIGDDSVRRDLSGGMVVWHNSNGWWVSDGVLNCHLGTAIDKIPTALERLGILDLTERVSATPWREYTDCECRQAREGDGVVSARDNGEWRVEVGGAVIAKGQAPSLDEAKAEADRYTALLWDLEGGEFVAREIGGGRAGVLPMYVDDGSSITVDAIGAPGEDPPPYVVLCLTGADGNEKRVRYEAVPTHYDGELRAFFERVRDAVGMTGDDCEAVVQEVLGLLDVPPDEPTPEAPVLPLADAIFEDGWEHHVGATIMREAGNGFGGGALGHATIQYDHERGQFRWTVESTDSAEPLRVGWASPIGAARRRAEQAVRDLGATVRGGK